MRPIDADALEHHVYTEWVNGELSNSEWVDFRQWLKDEPTVEPASPWHRVEDQLPEPGQDVLVYTYFYGRSIYAVAWLDNEGKWSFGTVTHWMPIEPPEEEQNDNNKM